MSIYGTAPSLEDIEEIARKALTALPEPFSRHLKGVILRVEDFADPDLLDELGIEDPFELTGLYSGRPAETPGETGELPPMILLFRRPILDEWAESEVDLEDLVIHVLVHETGHHFGLSDDDMEWMEIRLKAGQGH